MPKKTNRRQSLGLFASALSAGLVSEKASGQSSKDSERFVIRLEDTHKKIEDLFSQLAQDQALQKQFIQNPSSLIFENFTGERVRPSEVRVDESNRLIFSVLGNSKFMNWLQSYGKKKKLAKIEPAELLHDMAGAMLKFGDSDIVEKIYNKNNQHEFDPDKPETLLVAVALGVFFALVFAGVTHIGYATTVVVVTAFYLELDGLQVAEDKGFRGKNIRVIAEQLIAHSNKMAKEKEERPKESSELNDFIHELIAKERAKRTQSLLEQGSKFLELESKPKNEPNRKPKE